MSMIDEILYKHSEALAELAILRADRARLDWLERNQATLSRHGFHAHTCYGAEGNHTFGLTYRDAIDAAMQKEALSQPKQNP